MTGILVHNKKVLCADLLRMAPSIVITRAELSTDGCISENDQDKRSWLKNLAWNSPYRKMTPKILQILYRYLPLNLR